MDLLNLNGKEYHAGDSVRVSLNDSQELVFVWCSAGSFWMGIPEDLTRSDLMEKPQHFVTLSKGFWIGRTPITQEQWLAVMEERTLIIRHGENLPAWGMIWDDARDFCKQLTRRLQGADLLKQHQKIELPTEAQWEYACRAGTTSTWYFGNEVSELAQHGWYCDNSFDNIQSVGQKLSNPWGIYDLYGNVSEWCLDAIYRYPKHEVIDPIYLDEADSYKVIRGGMATDMIEKCRSASREMMGKNNTYNDYVGLRIVCIET